MLHHRFARTLVRAALLMAALVSAMLLAPPLAAQDAASTLPRHLWIAAYGASSGMQPVSSQGSSLGQVDAGRGMSFRIGWSGDSTLSVFIGFDQASLSTRDSLLAGPYAAHDMEIGGRINFPMKEHRHFVPFVEVAALARQMDAPLATAGPSAPGAHSVLSAHGFGGALDIGISMFVVPGAAIEAAAGAAIGPMTDLKVNGDTRWTGSVTAVSTRIRIGLALWPAAWLGR
jgi:hypothetical protein